MFRLHHQYSAPELLEKAKCERGQLSWPHEEKTPHGVNELSKTVEAAVSAAHKECT
jgi:hypothetical protein